MNSDKILVVAGTAISALLLILGGNYIIDTYIVADKLQTVGYTLPFEEKEVETAEAEPAAPAKETETADASAEAAAPAGEAKVADAAAPAAAAPADAPYVDQVVAALATASVGDGEKVFRKCKACHLVEKDAGHRSGPNLWNVVGRDKGSMDGYSYSKALAEKDGDWTVEALAGFMLAPKEYVEGTKMNYRGLKDPTDTANLIAYLKTLK